MTGDKGDRIELTCSVDSNPPARITWSTGDNDQRVSGEKSVSRLSISSSFQIGEGSRLELLLDDTTQENYRCDVEVAGFPKISKIFHVLVHAAPIIETETDVKHVEMGESATVFCQVSNVDPSLSIIWSHNNQEILPDNTDFSVLDTINTNTVRSVILIKNVGDRHLGDYVCNVTNKFGHSSASITLMEAEHVPRFMIVCSVISVCVLLIFIIIFVAICKPSPSTTLQTLPEDDHYVQINHKHHHQTPDILHSHQTNLPSQFYSPPPPPLPHHHHHHHHDDDHHRLVWTVPICTSSIKSDLNSDQDNYAFLRDHASEHHHHGHGHHHDHHQYFDLNESSPGTHV